MSKLPLVFDSSLCTFDEPTRVLTLPNGVELKFVFGRENYEDFDFQHCVLCSVYFYVPPADNFQLLAINECFCECDTLKFLDTPILQGEQLSQLIEDAGQSFMMDEIDYNLEIDTFLNFNGDLPLQESEFQALAAKFQIPMSLPRVVDC